MKKKCFIHFLVCIEMNATCRSSSNRKNKEFGHINDFITFTKHTN